LNLRTPGNNSSSIFVAKMIFAFFPIPKSKWPLLRIVYRTVHPTQSLDPRLQELETSYHLEREINYLSIFSSSHKSCSRSHIQRFPLMEL
jgi:hypothetical protein